MELGHIRLPRKRGRGKGNANSRTTLYSTASGRLVSRAQYYRLDHNERRTITLAEGVHREHHREQEA